MKVSAENRIKIQDICKRHDIRIMAVFGSAVTGSARDIDIAVYAKTGTSDDSINKLQLIAEVESIFHMKADIIIVNPATSTTLLYEICRHSLMLYEDKAGSFEDEKSVAFRKYADTFKFRKLREESINNFVRGAHDVT